MDPSEIATMQKDGKTVADIHSASGKNDTVTVKTKAGSKRTVYIEVNEKTRPAKPAQPEKRVPAKTIPPKPAKPEKKIAKTKLSRTSSSKKAANKDKKKKSKKKGKKVK